MTNYRRSRFRVLAVILSLGLVVAACGDDDATDEADPATRTVSTSRGDLEIPMDPQRIVVDWVTFDNLNAIGVDLDIVADVFEIEFFLDNPQFSPPLVAVAKGLDLAATSGSTYELNAEGLASLDPDLILLAEDQAPDEDVLSIMDDIAPVAIYDLPDGEKSFTQWRSGLESLAEVLGGDAPQDAADLIASFEADLADVRAEHADLIDAGLDVTTGKIAEDSVTLSMRGRNIGTEVTTELGLTRPVGQRELDVDEFNTVSLSLEQIGLLDADIIFLEQRQDDVEFLESNALFQALSAVQADNTVFVSNYWEFGGAGAASLVLADIDAALGAYEAAS